MKEVHPEVLFRIGGILHEARMEECYAGLDISSRKKWPATVKEFRGQAHEGQPWIDVAVAQVKALVAAGIVPEGRAPDTVVLQNSIELYAPKGELKVGAEWRSPDGRKAIIRMVEPAQGHGLSHLDAAIATMTPGKETK